MRCWATRSSTTSASPTARSSARPTRASSRTTTGRWCSTARSMRTATSTSPRRACASSRPASSARSAASSRPARRTRSRARSAARIRGRPTTRSSRRPTCSPFPAPGFTDDPRPVNGDDILNGTLITLYNKGNWPLLAQGLTAASQGDATTMRFLADAAWGNNFDGTFDPGTDRYFTIGAIEQKYPHDIDRLPRGRRQLVGHVRALLAQLGLRGDPLRALADPRQGRVLGPFTASKSAPTVLEVATTYDPATPFRGAKRLATQLGNVRFLTMVGDGHTAYQNGSPTCIDSAILAYIGTLTLPAKGTVCTQVLPFVQPPPAAATSAWPRWPPRGIELRRAAQVHPPARAPLDHPRTRWAPHQAPSAYALAHMRAASAIWLGTRTAGARVPRAGIAPRGLLPGRRDLGIEHEAAQCDAIGRDQAERAPARRWRGRRSSRRRPGRGRRAGSRARASRWRGRRRRRRAPSRPRPAPTTAPCR